MIVYIFLKDNISNGNVSDVLVKHYMLSFNTSESCIAFVGGMGRLRGLGQVGLVRRVGLVGQVRQVGQVGQVGGVKM